MKIYHLIAAVAFVTLYASLPGNPSLSQQETLGIFAGHTDVGNPAKAGTAIYDAEKQQYAISGAGANMWLGRDEFHYAWRRLKGNFILTTRAELVGKGVDEHRKIGWNVRSSLDPDSPHVTAVVHGDGLTSLQFRRTKGAITEQVISTLKAADVIQLERKGNVFVMSVARFGDPFVTEQIADIALGDEVHAGLFVCSHNKDVIEKAVFRDVRITVPASDTFVPYRDYIGSNLEVMEVATGARRILHTSPDSLQAPNWTTDGKALIYNSKGRLYRFDLAGKTPVVPVEIDTDFANNNNNDHVLSFDGKMLAISHHVREEENRSNVFVLPVTGGKLALGTWQGIYLAEHRARSHRREVLLQFVGSKRLTR